MNKKQFSFIRLWIPLVILFLCLSASQVHAAKRNALASLLGKEQQQDRKVSGVVTDANTNEPLIGVNVVIEGPNIGVITDFEGKFTINVPAQYEVLSFSYLGYLTEKVEIKGRTSIEVKLVPDIKKLDEVTLVAFAKQKKSSVIASITTIKPAELKVPSSNLTTALAGRMSGVISYQRSGEPGQDNAQFFIRGVTTFGYKKDPLILIDGIELTTQDLARIQPDDIASFSIMKDATATSLYGARGANGVIYVTTKEGAEGPAKISVRFENSISQPTRRIELADPITYMLMGNEAVKTRDPLEPLPYSQEKIEKTIAGVDPVLFPTTDWYKTMFNDMVSNQRFNFNVSGGGKIARYYIAGTVNQDNGIMKVDKRNNFNSNIDLKQYQLRSNLNINITKTTKLKFIFNATLDNYIGPIDGGTSIYNKVMRTNPVYFKPFYEPDAANQYTTHILFGNYGKGGYLNPYADMVKGYRQAKGARVLAQFEVNQDLSSLIEGLTFRVIANGNQYSYFDISRSYNPYFYAPSLNPETNEYTLTAINPETGTEYLGYSEGDKDMNTIYYIESALQYNKKFADRHDVSALLVGTSRDELRANTGSLQKSLPYRNSGLSGRFTYAYDERYFTELNFGYNGSERFAQNNRFGFFPSAGIGWIISNEKYFESFKKVISNLKFKATYGLIGNDAIGSEDDRFFYMSEVNMQDVNKSSQFGKFFDYTKTGVSIRRYANDMITWETSKKLNLGMELGLLEKFTFIVDVFKENRSNILMDRISLASMGLQADVRANVGEAMSKGIDASLDYNAVFGRSWWIQARTNFTYATSEITKMEEPDYSSTPWLSRVGKSINQQWGYVSERLFVDQLEVDNSPEQSFGKYSGGDIKYRDINGDDRISGLDRVPIGFPTSPEIVYGMGFSVGYKTFDYSVFFQGLARESFWIDTYGSAPFVNNNQLLKVWADSYWSEEQRNVYARWPRLSNQVIENNNQTNTWFMQDGSFIRLKSMEFGYSIPPRLLARFKMTRFRIYASGTNLLTFSKFKLWDPEMGGNGLGYPIQKVINLGVNIDF